MAKKKAAPPAWLKWTVCPRAECNYGYMPRKEPRLCPACHNPLDGTSARASKPKTRKKSAAA